MQVIIVPSSVSGEPVQMFTTYLINGTVAIDAGSVGMYGSIDQQARIKHIFLTHIHIDHVASLGPFVDAVYDGTGECVTVYGNAYTLDCLRKDFFNNRLYPDFFHISTFRPAYIKAIELTPGVPVELDGLRITPVEVNHVVPTVGFVVEDDHSAVVFPSDTAPTEEIWKVARSCPHLKAVFLESTFPESMGWLAELAKHLTPSLYAREMKKLDRPARWITVHMHPRHRPIVVQELLALGLPGVEIGESGKTYTF
jgi:ribonuclease BN (tRNA processing enzyme)